MLALKRLLFLSLGAILLAQLHMMSWDTSIASGPALTEVQRPADASAGREVPSVEATTSTVFLPLLQEGPCDTHTASMTLSATAATCEVGQAVTVTLSLFNEGCVGLGLPQYSLYVDSDGPSAILEPSYPEPVVHYLGIGTGQSDAQEFVLWAVEPGQATLRGSTSFEVHLGYPGPAYWGGSTAAPLEITVVP